MSVVTIRVKFTDEFEISDPSDIANMVELAIRRKMADPEYIKHSTLSLVSCDVQKLRRAAYKRPE